MRIICNPAVDDMKPGSFFLSTLNDNPNTALPASRYAIFGAEDYYDYVRLADALNEKTKNNLPLASGNYIKFHHYAAAFYGITTAYLAYLATRYLIKYYNADQYDPWRDEYYDRYVFFSYASRQWLRGFLSLVFYQQRDWDKFVVGVDYFNIDGDIYREKSDGLLPATTQAPSFFGSFGSSVLEARGANHISETAHPSVKERLVEIFQRPDVNIEEVANGDPIDPPFPEPCYDGNHQVICTPCTDNDPDTYCFEEN